MGWFNHQLEMDFEGPQKLEKRENQLPTLPKFNIGVPVGFFLLFGNANFPRDFTRSSF